MTQAEAGPLTGLRVIEIGHFVAAPFCTRLLADLGADVVKVEPPGGDPVRKWGGQKNGNSVWFSQHSRNKKSITLNLKHETARDIVLRLCGKADALVENFRPGQMEKFGLGDARLRQAKPDLVVAHISGFGQNGPYRDRAAFGVIGEAIGGLRHLTNHAPGTSDLPPVRVGISIGDSIAGLYAAFGIVSACWRRDERRGGDGRGRSLDVALTDAVLSMMEGLVPEYSVLGSIRQPTGSRIPTAAPTSAYPTSEGGWILIAANSDPLFAKLAGVIGKPELTANELYRGNQNRCTNVEALDEEIAGWTRQHTAAEADRILSQADIPCTQLYTAKEIAADPQFRARGMIQEVEDPLFGRVLHTGVVPYMPECGSGIRWPGPEIGQHTGEVLRDWLGMTAADIEGLRQEEVV